MAARSFSQRFDSIDRRITRWMAGSGLVLLRISMGVIYLWFGALKLIPGLSPAEPLIRASWGFAPLPTSTFVALVGALEMVIGLGLITGFFLRGIILLMGLQLLGAMSPLVFSPERLFAAFPFSLTLEGQYVLKDIVLIAAALVVGATVRGGGLTARPEVMTLDQDMGKSGKKAS